VLLFGKPEVLNRVIAVSRFVSEYHVHQALANCREGTFFAKPLYEFIEHCFATRDKDLKGISQ
jgi:flagellar biosynthesis regulator FlbT